MGLAITGRTGSFWGPIKLAPDHGNGLVNNSGALRQLVENGDVVLSDDKTEVSHTVAFLLNLAAVVARKQKVGAPALHGQPAGLALLRAPAA